MPTGGIKLFKEGQLLQHKQRFTTVRLDGIVPLNRLGPLLDCYGTRKRLPMQYLYVLRSLNGQRVKVIHARELSRYWNILIDPSLLTSDNVQELKRQLEVAKFKEKYELCAMLRDRIASLNGAT